MTIVKHLKKTTLTTPLGDLRAFADDQYLYRLEFCLQEKGGVSFQQRMKANVLEGRTPVIDLLEKELQAYFQGKLKKFSVPLHIEGSVFQKTVWKELQKIPHGETRSYKDLAQALNDPLAVRAVGTANSQNNFPIIIPCHRVINADGKLGGYAGGVDRKEWLLKHEKQSSGKN